MPLLKNFYLTLDIKMSTSSALWALFLQFNCLLYKQNTAFGLAAAGPRRKVRRSLEPESITFQSCKTSKTRRVCHGHVRQLIRTGQTIDQISIARPPTGRIPPAAPCWIRHCAQSKMSVLVLRVLHLQLTP